MNNIGNEYILSFSTFMMNIVYVTWLISNGHIRD